MLLSYVFWETVAQHALFYAAVFFTALFISTWRPVVALTPKWDVSYGIYLYGWPAQQIVTSVAPGHSRPLDMLMTITIAAACGCLSWVFVERPSLAFGRELLKQKFPMRARSSSTSFDSNSG